jgi:hypothetical protein
MFIQLDETLLRVANKLSRERVIWSRPNKVTGTWRARSQDEDCKEKRLYGNIKDNTDISFIKKIEGFPQLNNILLI